MIYYNIQETDLGKGYGVAIPLYFDFSAIIFKNSLKTINPRSTPADPS